VAEDAQIGLDLGADAGAHHLQDHRRAVGQLGAVHLRDRGRAQRLALELAKQLQRRAAQRPLDLRQQGVEGDRRDVGLQRLELGNPVRREQVHAGGEHLAELDEGGPQLGQRHAHALRRGELHDLRACTPAQHLARALQQTSHSRAAHQVAEAVPDQHQRDLVQARKVAHGLQGLHQHGRIIAKAQVDCAERLPRTRIGS